MKTTLRTIAAAAVVTLAAVTPAFAAPTYSDNSGLLVWSFLGFCAVIVVAQVLPAVMMMVGIVKGVATEGTQVKAHN
jgi:hypothetical protein